MTSDPGTTSTETAAPGSSSRAGSRSVSSVEAGGAAGSGGRYAAGAAAGVASDVSLSSHATYSPQEQKSRLTTTVPHFGHSACVDETCVGVCARAMCASNRPRRLAP